MNEIFMSMSIGLGVWAFVYGVNRVYLTFKRFVS
jgi:hypothetical protein